tara:strand:+ start:82 stop:249 length:168 start_codon:yes stop_codon:yes gene_type:complete
MFVSTPTFVGVATTPVGGPATVTVFVVTDTYWTPEISDQIVYAFVPASGTESVTE